MITPEAVEEYAQAVKQGLKETKELISAGKNPNPAVLDDILGPTNFDTALEVGLVEIPAERIVGTKSAGRITAFSASFLPLLSDGSEFSTKWKQLCSAHLSDEGIREAIECFEYMGNFYVQEGNKRVSVLRYFGAPRIPGNVKRILPPKSDDPGVRAYYEFLDYYKYAKLYIPRFTRPGDYSKFLKLIGKKPGEEWSEDERRTFNSRFHYFTHAFESMKAKPETVGPEEALMLWLQLYPYEDLSRLSSTELLKTLDDLSDDVVTAAYESTVQVETTTGEEPKSNILTWMISPDKIHIAFVHQLTPGDSAWVTGHEEGRKYIEEVFGEKVVCKSYFEANTLALGEEKIEEAIRDGATVIFTTSPMLSRASLKLAVKYPKVRIFNCSVSQPYASIRTYYGRMYEAKFISGAIAGAMAQNNRIGYIASYPILGTIASINAFALGAQLTNPRAQIELGWSCCEGNPQAEFFTDGIRVVSNRQAPSKNRMYLDFCSYGTYLMGEHSKLIPLGMPVWVWGKFYEVVVNYYLCGKKVQKDHYSAINYWLGMDSGVIDIELSDQLPAGVRMMAQLLRKNLIEGTLDPFARKIVAQDGTVKNDGTRFLTPKERLSMDWLCENVIGSIPSFDQILPSSRTMVRELGIYRDSIPGNQEVSPREDFDRER